MTPFTQNTHTPNPNYLTAGGREAVGADYGSAANTALRTPSRIHHIFADLSAR
ncbi:MAG TPA: hypothetical protein VJ324_10375 [Candidatus Acidoferrum sp.]|nr:hypothetical protein [Candidatus Acidoferrum sp.]